MDYCVGDMAIVSAEWQWPSSDICLLG